MKNFKLSLIIAVLALFMMLSAVSANDLATNDTLADDGNAVYVDAIEGNDLNDGKTADTSVKSLDRALNITDENATVYVASGSYDSSKNTRLVINRSVTIIGSAGTEFDGHNVDYLFTINDNVSVTFKNITFKNAYKLPSNEESVYGAALDIRNAHVTLENCIFTDNTVDNNKKSAIYGGAISNFGDLTVINSVFINNTATSAAGLFSAGGAIYNRGKLSIRNSTISNSRNGIFSYGGAIANYGTLEIDSSQIIGSHISSSSRGSAIFNNGKLLLTNSIIRNSVIEKTGIDQFFGAIYNDGEFTAYGNVFQNNSAAPDSSAMSYKGSGNIYSIGDLNMTCNAFIDNYDDYYGIGDVYYNGGNIISLDNNWWSTNENPYDDGRINVEEVYTWITFTLTPEYSPLNISDSIKIKAAFNGDNLDLFPLFNTTFSCDFTQETKELKDGTAEFEYTYTNDKGLYEVTAEVCGFKQTVLVDVGKIISELSFNLTDNIEYLDTLKINVSVTGKGHTAPTGRVFLYINSKRYTLDLEDGNASFEKDNMDPGIYNVRFVYDGDENYFKAFENTTLTIKKQPVNLTMDIPSIKIDEKSTVATISLLTRGAQGFATLYLSNGQSKNVYLYNGQTTVTLRNLEEGEYNATLAFRGTAKYEAVNVTTTFRVSKYSTVLNVYSSDINAGETASILIEALPEDLRGEAILSINGVNNTIFIGDANTTVNITNLGYGRYDVSVIYLGDAKYYGANDTTSFRVSRQSSSLSVDIMKNADNLNGTVTVRTNPSNCTGLIGLYINYRFYSMNLTNGTAAFEVEFDQGTNYIFAYFEGDDYYEDSTYNTTIGVADVFVFIGQNSTGFEKTDFNYSVRLIEVTGIPMPNRNVTVTLQDKTYYIITDDDGFAYLPLNLDKGTYHISATYENKTINNTLTVKEIRYDISINDTVYGDIVIIEVDCDENLTGEFNFYIKDILDVNVTVSNGKAVYNLSGLDAGRYSVAVKYATLPSQKSKEFMVNRADLNAGVIFNQREFSITVVNLENITGNVSFIIDGEKYSNSTNSSCAVLFKNLTEGNHTLTVKYAGDVNYNPFTLNTFVFVKEFTTNVILAIEDGIYGEDLTVTARLNRNATGTVRFSVENQLKEVEIVDGIAEWTFSGINAGLHFIKAVYLGDENFLDSQNETSFEVFKANSTIAVYVNEALLDENIRIYANLSANATGSVLFSMDGYYSPRYKNVRNSQATWYISPLDTGTYRVSAKYIGDDNYYASNTTYLLNIYQKKAVLEVTIKDARVIDRVVVNVGLTNKTGYPLNGTVSLDLNSRSYEIDVENGEASLVVGRLPADNYTYHAAYDGNEEYGRASATGEFEVRDTLLNVIITTNNLTKFYKGSQQLSVHVKTTKNNVVANQELIVTVKGKNYTIMTDKDGRAFMDIGLAPGNYTALITLLEDDMYHTASANASIIIMSTVEAIDVVKLYGTSSQYFAIFADSNGKPLANTDVKFKIGSKSYTAKTLPNGIVRLNINLSPGSYTITAINPVTSQKAKNTILVYLRLMENKDVRKYFKGTQKYKVRAYGDDGKAAAGVTVKIKVNSKTYKVRTDSKGYAKLNINLKPGKYTIKATYKGFTVKNKVTVKSTLVTKDISKKKSKTVKFTAKVLDTKGNVAKGKKVTFTFKGSKHKVTTNSKGIAAVSLKNLKVGKYTIKTTYGKLNIKNSIKIR